ncbi:hypothetical protein MHY1_03124 [Methylovirgula sp. HY1]|nr:hypothetical protein MHY1_03124 [Methylovirgula sp. HY1]
MRHTVRPFIKEFKKRSSKSTMPHPPIDDTENDGAKPLPFLDLGGFVAYENNHDDEYEAALKAADAVFGRSSSATSVEKEASSFKDVVGRVLPSLIDEDSALSIRLAAAEEKTRRRRKVVEKPDASSFPLRRKASRAPKRELVQAAAEQPAAMASPEVPNVSAPRREPSAIQKRWVLKTALKAGQKWQRRLCKAARR